MMDLELKYKVIFVTSLDLSLEFFTTRIGFEKQEDLEVAGRDCTVLKMFNGDFLMLVQNEEIESEPAILYTDDCLRDYYRLRIKQVADLTLPEYVSEGLSITFSDPSGNRFMLLEKRDYTDD